MSRTMLLATLIALSGCATGPYLNCDESCAMQNMVCTGQTMGESSGSAMNLHTLATTAINSSNVTYVCAKDASQASKIEQIKKEYVAKHHVEIDDSCPPAVRNYEPQNCKAFRH